MWPVLSVLSVANVFFWSVWPVARLLLYHRTGMGIRKQIVQYGQRRIARRLLRAAPWLGGVVALATLGATMRRKGVIRGTVDTALDFIPGISLAKNAAEIIRGRDLIPDKPRPVVIANRR